ncbi:uncharacterized protein LOC134200792 [Bombyx mori]|uniref:uncharacterized protein LOC134200792 n=1 Tax=Bombyx mori TaxID=7091 RepID=UPI002ECFD523
MLAGSVPDSIADILYGANLCALMKRDGGIRPIAVGSTLRRIVSKLCCKEVLPILSGMFRPIQLGVGTKSGCEAAVHAARTFLKGGGAEVLVKVDLKNAFNCIDRNAFLKEVKEHIPSIYPYLYQCYGNPSKLVYKENLVESATGCQQGDPLGPAIFSLGIHPVLRELKSSLNLWYLDDGTLGGDISTVLKDLEYLKSALASLGLELNFAKCELFINASCCSVPVSDVFAKFNTAAPNIKVVDENSLMLLGAPILDGSIDAYIDEQIDKFSQCSNNLFEINSHMALFIIRHCLFVPKFTYVLRCSFLWKHNNKLNSLDEMIKGVLCKIINCNLDDLSWEQCVLPVRFGGIGVRKASAVALPAFLASAHASCLIVGNVLNPCMGSVEIVGVSEAGSAWQSLCQADFPTLPHLQRLWDTPLCQRIQQRLLQSYDNSVDIARFRAVTEKESSYWLQAYPSSNTGTLLDNNALSLAIGLRLGAHINVPHFCVCGEYVNELGHHGLSCQKSAGRIPRHASLNDMIRRALTTVNVPAVLEPIGILRSDGKRPDGVTLIPWSVGRCLVWDATCVDTVAPCHLDGTSSRPGSAAASAEITKKRKYSGLGSSYSFLPFAVETMGPWGPEAKNFLTEISKRLKEVTHDAKAGWYFAQRVSLAVQRGNVASILGTVPPSSALEDLFYCVG